MPFSKDILMGSSGNQAAADPSRISQSDFEAFTDNGTYSTWNYAGYSASGGNTLTLASPGSNVFREHNTIKPGGFTGHTFIQFSDNGFAWGLAGMFQTSTAAEADEGWLETQTSTYTIFRKHLSSWTYLNYYKDGSNNPNVGAAWGTGSGYNESGPVINLASGQHKSYTDSNPFFVRIGRDENDFIYTQGFYAGGNTAPDLEGTGFTVTDKYYLNISTSTWQTNTTGARTLSDGIQFGWGNYDLSTVEQHRHVEFWTAGD